MIAADVFDQLLNKARAADEFEYVCALLRIRGMEDEGWDPLEETQRLYDDIGSLMQAPLHDFARVRLGLLLYSHLTEVDAVYMILANMVEITAGERCVMNPFQDLYRPRGSFADLVPPSARAVVERLKERAVERGFSELVELLESFFNDAVRNAFFHSDYILHGDEFRSREARFIDENNIRTSALKLPVILDLINRSASFFHDFMTGLATRRARSYAAGSALAVPTRTSRCSSIRRAVCTASEVAPSVELPSPLATCPSSRISAPNRSQHEPRCLH